jgi:uncharacterized YccA/Bax inhibitor family protein
MTMNGAIGKTAVLLFLAAFSAAFTWQQHLAHMMAAQGIAVSAFVAAQTALVQSAAVRFCNMGSILSVFARVEDYSRRRRRLYGVLQSEVECAVIVNHRY